VVLQNPDKTIVEVPCGLVIWAAGNKGRKLTQDLMAKLPADQTNKRGITVDGTPTSPPSLWCCFLIPVIIVQQTTCA